MARNWLAGVLLMTTLFGLGCGRREIEKSELVIAFKGLPLTLMPHRRTEIITLSVQANLFEGLAGFDADMKIVPLLAASWENPDDRTWLFNLRPGVKFHDGSPLTAEDVVYSIRQAMDHPESALKSNCGQISALAATGSLSVKIVTRLPSPVLLHKLNTVFILPRRTLEQMGEEEFARHPVGTGPYRLEAVGADGTLRLAAWTGYWGAPPEFSRMRIIRYNDPGEAVRLLLAGRADIATEISPEQARRMEHDRTATVAVVSRPGLALRLLGMDTTRPPFHSLQVRRALALAVDRRRLVERILYGYGTPANQMVPQAVFGFDPGLPGLPYDPGTARKLLADAGYVAGLDLRLLLSRVQTPLGKELQAQMAAAGIRLELDLRERQDFFAAVDTSPFFVLGSVSSTGDASDLLDDLYHSTAAAYGRENNGRYANPEVDLLIEALPSSQNQRQRLETMQRIMGMVVGDMPRVPLYIEDEIYGVNAAIAWKPRLDLKVLGREVHSRRR